MILTEDQLYDITKKRRHGAQAKALAAMGIDFRARADGSLVVSQAHVEKVLGGEVFRANTKDVEPNWEYA